MVTRHRLPSKEGPPLSQPCCRDDPILWLPDAKDQFRPYRTFLRRGPTAGPDPRRSLPAVNLTSSNGCGERPLRRLMARCQSPLSQIRYFGHSAPFLSKGNNSKRIAVLATKETCDARPCPRHRASGRLSLPRRPFQSHRRAASSRDLPLYRLPQIERIDLLGLCNLADRCIRADGTCRHLWRTKLLPDLRRTCYVGSRRGG